MLNRRRFLMGLSGLATTAALPGCITVPSTLSGQSGSIGTLSNGLALDTPLGMVDTGGSRAFTGRAVLNAKAARAVFDEQRNPWYAAKTANQWLAEFSLHAPSTADRLLEAAAPMQTSPLDRQTLDAMISALKPAFHALHGYELRQEADYLQRNPRTLRRNLPRVSIDEQGGLIIPAGATVTFTQESYCLDKELPAPKRGEKLRLMPMAELLPENLMPLMTSLQAHVQRTPRDYNDVQQIMWAMRAIKQCDPAIANLNNRLMGLMDKAHPNGAALYQSAYQSECTSSFGQLRDRLRQKMSGSMGGLAPLADPLSDVGAALGSIPNGLQELSRRVMNPSVRVNGRPVTALDLFNANQTQADTMVSSILADLSQREPDTAIRQNDSDLTLLAPGVAARIVGTDELVAQYTITNTSSTPFTFRPADYAVYSERATQRMPVLPISERDVRMDHRNTGILDSLPFSDRARAIADELQADLTRAAIEMAAYVGLPRWLSGAHQAFRNPLVRGLTQRVIKGIPLVGNAIALHELITGEDFFKEGDDLNVTERALAGLSIVPGLNSLTALGRAGMDVAQSSAVRRALMGALQRGTPAYRAMDGALSRTLVAREAVDVVAGNDELGIGDAMDAVYQSAFSTSGDMLNALAAHP